MRRQFLLAIWSVQGESRCSRETPSPIRCRMAAARWQLAAENAMAEAGNVFAICVSGFGGRDGLSLVFSLHAGRTGRRTRSSMHAARVNDCHSPASQTASTHSDALMSRSVYRPVTCCSANGGWLHVAVRAMVDGDSPAEGSGDRTTEHQRSNGSRHDVTESGNTDRR